VLGAVSKAGCKARFRHINEFERTLTENGVVLLKFFLHLSKAEQAKRFRARLKDPAKNWKFSRGDLKTRKRWDEYMEAYEDAINACSPAHCRWHIVAANNKWYRDFVIARRVVGALEELKMDWPRPKEDLSKIRVV